MNEDNLMAAQAAHARGEFTEAQIRYEAIVASDPNTVAAWEGLAHIAYEKKSWQAAIDYLTKALACDISPPLRAQLLTYQGIGYQNLNQLNQAEMIFRAALTADPTHYRAQYNLGTLYAKQDKWQLAVLEYECVTQQQPHFAQVWQNLATAYWHLADPAKSLAVLQAGHRYLPDEKNIAIALAAVETYFGQQQLAADKIVEAKQYFLAAVQHNAADVVAQYNLGVIAYQTQEWALAEQQFVNVIRLDEHHFEAHYNLFLIYKKCGVMAAAREKLKYLHEQYPNNEVINYLWASFTGYKQYTQTPPQFVRELFDAYAPHFDQDLLGALNYQLPSVVDALLAASKIEWPVARALDMGCGTGLCGEILRARTQQLVGVDLSAAMLHEAHKKNIYDDLHCADCVAVLAEQKWNRFDLILAADIFGYFGDLTPIFAHIKLNLTTQGIFVFSIESGKEEEIVQGFQLTDTGRFVHTEAYIRQLCSHYAFNIQSVKTMPLRDQRGKSVLGQVFLLTQK